MYFIPIGIFVSRTAPDTFLEAIGKNNHDYANLTLDNFFMANLLPVSIGNIIGGAVLVGMVYWFVYIRRTKASSFSPD